MSKATEMAVKTLRARIGSREADEIMEIIDEDAGKGYDITYIKKTRVESYSAMEIDNIKTFLSLQGFESGFDAHHDFYISWGDPK